MKERKFYVAGVQHHNLPKVISRLIEGDDLDLVPEPTNKFDSNAVRIEYEGIMLGYVPRKLSAEISAALEVGTNLSCTIETLTPENKPWEQLEVVILEDDGEESETSYEEEDEDDGYEDIPDDFDDED